MNRSNARDSEIRIVPLTREHLERLVEMEAQVFSVPWSLESFQELFRYDYCHYLVAVNEAGIPVGIAGMTLLEDDGEIEKVMVDPAYRRRGIAAALLEGLFQMGAELGAKAYTLEVRVGNEGAIRLYEKYGFRTEGVRPNFYEKPKEDALIMWRRKT